MDILSCKWKLFIEALIGDASILATIMLHAMLHINV